ncbi:MAG: hypothetical protein E6R09_09970 [Rhodocyclaceae bacterium]|nr:MAG: hypothetical protein E6R09_09970 [Rhodocyclaceae bacterium]
MTDPISNEDQLWLDALAGKNIADPNLSAHAQVVRQALQKRRKDIEADAARDRSNEFARLHARLQKEGLIRGKTQPSRTWAQEILNWLFPDTQSHSSAGGGSRTRSKVVPLAVLIALIGAALWLTTQMRAPQVDERLIYRGDPNVVTLLVDDPEQRTNVLQTALKALPGTVTVQALKPNGWLLRVQDSDSVRDYLATQRIEGVPVNGQITLLVLPSKDIKH